MITKIPTTHSQKGFTLVEMMVSIMIFTIVAVVAIGALLKIIDANKKAQALETAVNNLDFTLDSITREMRVGTSYYCGSTPTELPVAMTSLTVQDCTTSSGPWVIAFNSSHTSTVGANTCQLIYYYYYDSNKVLNKGQQQNCNDATYRDHYYPVIANNNPSGSSLDSYIMFTTASVAVSTYQNTQSYAHFHFAGTAGFKDKTQTDFDIQTTVSQRLPN